MHSDSPQELLIGSFRAALAAASPQRVVPPHLPRARTGRTLVVGADKAAAAMSQAVEAHYPAPVSGVVVTRYGYGLPTRQIEVIEAGHPLPDANGQQAAQRILDTARQLTPDDLLLVLLSGGGSSLLNLPCAGLSLPDIQAVTHDLLRCGARIEEINSVRKHLSAIQGGQLAVSTSAQVHALIISDVTGDNPTHIASGPCSADPTTYCDAIKVLKQYSIDPPKSILDHLHSGVAGEIAETPKPGDPRLIHTDNRIVASGAQMLEAAAAYFSAHGYTPINLGDCVTGEARLVAQSHAELVRRAYAEGNRNIVYISGGETSVTLRGNGKGGRNSEYLLALSALLTEYPNISALACDTDGIDGSEHNAGAFFTPELQMRASTARLNAQHYLNNNDSFSYFEALDSLVVTGPTHTNVNDYRVILLR
ncbi:MAG: glycerate kinase [Pseudomonadota bacterium]